MDDFDAFLADLDGATASPVKKETVARGISQSAKRTTGNSGAVSTGGEVGKTYKLSSAVTVTTGLIFDMCPKCRSSDVTTNRARSFSVCESCGYAVDPSNSKSAKQLAGEQSRLMQVEREHVAQNRRPMQDVASRQAEWFQAATQNQPGKMKELLGLGFDINYRDPVSQRTALHFAAAKQANHVVKLLVEGGIDVNLRNNIGQTALHVLVLDKNDKMAVWLIQKGADIRIKDKSGHTPVDLTLPHVQREFERAFQARREGAADQPADLNARTVNRTQQERQAAHSGRTVEATVAMDAREVVKVYLKNDAYKSITISGATTAEQLLSMMANKLSLPEMTPHLQIMERVKEQGKYVERPIGANIRLLVAKARWPVIFGESGNETERHCRFIITIRRGSPLHLQEAWKQKLSLA